MKCFNEIISEYLTFWSIKCYYSEQQKWLHNRRTAVFAFCYILRTF